MGKTEKYAYRSNRSVFLYPEQTRSRNGILKRKFKTGGARLAISMKKNILPITVTEGWKLYPGKFRLNSNLTIKMFIGNVISTKNLTLDSRYELTEMIRNAIADYLPFCKVG